ncbi:MAG: 4-hydroxybenzoate octaprenyltransferase [Gammaproteobacteria bacterium]|nr:4-hydroxybenzoate octaprenyltransferase [Gammaproteobacteria bacterium]
MQKSELTHRPVWSAYWRLMRLHRPIGTLLLLWPALWALWIAAAGVPDRFVLAVFVGGTLLMRSAGCVINDYADRHFDGRVHRTRDRPLATGEISPAAALRLFGALVVAAGALVLTLNWLTVALALVAVPLAIIYPFLKRCTHLPQVWLGVAFAWAVPMAFAAQSGTVPPLAWLMLSAVVLWVLVYDTQYAMVDRADDRKIGIKSTAILFADYDRLAIGVCQLLLLADLVVIGRLAHLAGAFWLALLVATGLGIFQQWLIRRREPAACFKAFMSNNWLGGALFVGIAAHYGAG